LIKRVPCFSFDFSGKLMVPLMKNSEINRPVSFFARAGALFLSFALVVSTFAVAQAQRTAMAQQTSTARRVALNEEQRITHVLNRLGFGARPGDVERVRRMGLERYIEQQLNPEQIADASVEARLRNLQVLTQTTAELLARYPAPGQLIRQLQRQGRLPEDLAALRGMRGGQTRNNAGMNTTPANGNAPATNEGAMVNESASGQNAPQISDAQRNEYRRAVREYYRENNLQQPQRILQELQAARIIRAAHSERQLQEVMVDFWMNHFNVYANKGADRWLLPAYERDAIRPRTVARFRDLLQATAQSPAMLFYLDNFQSVSPNAPQMGRRGQGLRGMLGGNRRMMNRGLGGGQMRGQMGAQTNDQMNAQQQRRPQQGQGRRRGINENYARELLELHTLGVDGGYTQQDIVEIARCFTGWTIFDPRGATVRGGEMEGNPRARRMAEMFNVTPGGFYFNPLLHDDGEKIVLGQRIPAGGGINDGLRVLDILARHPSTARFIATKLARRFVTDNPSPALVERVAAAFTRSDGDIRQTLRAIFTSPEFFAPETYRAKIKTPFEVAVSAIRALDGETNGSPALHQWIARMGEPLYQYQAPTGYPDTAEHWVNTGALLERLNFGLALASNSIRGTRINFAANNSTANANHASLIDAYLHTILGGDVSTQTRATLLRQSSEPPTTTARVGTSTEAETEELGESRNDESGQMTEMRRGEGRRRNAQMNMQANLSPAEQARARVIGLILGSPEFQRQ
jgi:uncharacterized protein (DUF1800 family)